MSLWVVGFVRNMVIEPKTREDRGIKYTYFFMWMGMLACWGMGIYWRFKPSGRYACADTKPDNLAFNSEPDWKEQIMGEANNLIQEESCRFIKLYIDIAGLYIGGYGAWIILGFTGAARTPTWSPRREGQGLSKTR